MQSGGALFILFIDIMFYNIGMDNTIDFEDRKYIDPKVYNEQTNSFIEQLRRAQVENQAQVAKETEQLGTDVAPSQGGLLGAESYFNKRLQSPKVDSIIDQLKQTAQSQALNQVLSNYQQQMQKRYKDAYNDFQKRGHDYNMSRARKQDSMMGGGGNYTIQKEPTKGEVEIKSNKQTGRQVTVGEKAPRVPSADNPLFGSTGSIKSSESFSAYFEKDGKRTGVKLYKKDGRLIGVETPSMSYTARGGENYLDEMTKSGARLYDVNGQDITAIWRLK